MNLRRVPTALAATSFRSDVNQTLPQLSFSRAETRHDMS